MYIYIHINTINIDMYILGLVEPSTDGDLTPGAGPFGNLRCLPGVGEHGAGSRGAMKLIGQDSLVPTIWIRMDTSG